MNQRVLAASIIALISTFAAASADAATVVNRHNGDALTLECVGEAADSTSCSMYRVRVQTADGARALTRAFAVGELDAIRSLPFLDENECPLRKKKNCLAPELWVSVRPLDERRAQVAARRAPHGRYVAHLDVDQVFIPFGLTTFAGKRSLSETMLLTIPADAILFVPDLFIHGTLASMLSSRRKRVLRAMQSLTGGRPRPTRLSNRVFVRLVRALEAGASTPDAAR